MATVAAAPFVGRSRERETLRALFAEAKDRRGAVALLVGAPGIGKSRMARELAAEAAADGASVLWGNCYEAAAASPYGPWAEAVVGYAHDLGPAALSTRVGIFGGALVEAVPELRSWLPHVHPAPALPAEAAKLRIYQAFAECLRGDAVHLVVLDDLQWADSASLALLEYLTRQVDREPLLVIAAMRDVDFPLAHPVSQLLGELGRRPAYHRIALRPMAPDEAWALARELLGAEHTAALAAVVDEAGGNPFYLQELARHVLEHGEGAIPAGVRNALARRVAAMQPATAQMLSLACALTRPFQLDVLERVSGWNEADLLDALDEALHARLLRVTEGGESYEFAHALVRQALYDELNPSRKARLHRRIAEALEALPTRPSTRTELVLQYVASKTLPGEEHGIPHALAAAASARASAAHAEAVSLLRLTLELADRVDDATRCDILCALALAEADAVQIDDAARTAEKALPLLPRQQTSAFLAELTLALKDAGAPRQVLEPLVRRGLAAAETHDLTWARLKLAEIPVEIIAHEPVVIGRWLGFDPEAVAIAREQGNELDYARTIELMDWRTREETEELLRVAESWGDSAAAVHVLSVVARSFEIQHGKFRRAGEVARRLLELSERVGSLPGQAYALVYLARVWADLGDAAASAELTGRAREVVARLGSAHRLHYSFIHRFTPGAAAESAELRLAAARDSRVPAWMTATHAARAAEDYALAGQHANAESLFRVLLPVAQQLRPTTLNQNGLVAFLGSVAWELQLRSEASVVRRLARALIDAGVGDYGETSTELTIARMAALLGEDEGAREWFERARRTLDASSQRRVRAIVDYDEAVWRAGLGEPPDPEFAAELAARFEQLGDDEWAERARALTKHLPAGLSKREAEILRLLAGGRSNKQIAAELVLSVHTVERHVANIYRKIGAHNRAEAAAFAVTHGIQN